MIGENQHKYGLRTGDHKSQGWSRKDISTLFRQSICSTLVGGHTDILRESLCHSIQYLGAFTNMRKANLTSLCP
jgi:hypothetical protein